MVGSRVSDEAVKRALNAFYGEMHSDSPWGTAWTDLMRTALEAALGDRSPQGQDAQQPDAQRESPTERSSGTPRLSLSEILEGKAREAEEAKVQHDFNGRALVAKIHEGRASAFREAVRLIQGMEREEVGRAPAQGPSPGHPASPEPPDGVSALRAGVASRMLSTVTWNDMPSCGEMDFQQLVEAVSDVMLADRKAVKPQGKVYIGHEIIGTINYNSLNRIVTAFVRAALAPVCQRPCGEKPSGFEGEARGHGDGPWAGRRPAPSTQQESER